MTEQHALQLLPWCPIGRAGLLLHCVRHRALLSADIACRGGTASEGEKHDTYELSD